MARPVTSDELVRGLEAAAASFDPGELAYLALTSKPELAIRDRLAWALTRDDRRVAREWRERCDLAVVADDGEPLGVLEAKASYTHDTRWSMGREKLRALQSQVGGSTALETLLRADAAKVRRLSGTGHGYILLIAMHRHDAVPPHLLQVVKEAARRVRAQPDAEAELAGYLRPLGPVSRRVELGRGEAFGIGMTVAAWVCGPLRPSTESRDDPSPRLTACPPHGLLSHEADPVPRRAGG